MLYISNKKSRNYSKITATVVWKTCTCNFTKTWRYYDVGL